VDAEIIQPCACCGQRITESEWRQMGHRGLQDFDDPETILELRSCKCGTTRAREIPRPPMLPVRS
jgi:hypothetical protein